MDLVFYFYLALHFRLAQSQCLEAFLATMHESSFWWNPGNVMISCARVGAFCDFLIKSWCFWQPVVWVFDLHKSVSIGMASFFPHLTPTSLPVLQYSQIMFLKLWSLLTFFFFLSWDRDCGKNASLPCDVCFWQCLFSRDVGFHYGEDSGHISVFTLPLCLPEAWGYLSQIFRVKTWWDSRR